MLCEQQLLDHDKTVMLRESQLTPNANLIQKKVYQCYCLNTESVNAKEDASIHEFFLIFT